MFSLSRIECVFVRVHTGRLNLRWRRFEILIQIKNGRMDHTIFVYEIGKHK